MIWIILLVVIVIITIVLVVMYKKKWTKKDQMKINRKLNDSIPYILDATISGFENQKLGKPLKEYLQNQGFSKEEIKSKKSIILQNLDRMKRLQKENENQETQENLKPVYDLNNFILYSREEFFSLYSGLIYPTTTIKTSPSEYGMIEIDQDLLKNLPNEFDWTLPKKIEDLITPELMKDKNFKMETLDQTKTYQILPATMDQGECGSCYAIASCNIMSAVYNKTIWKTKSGYKKLDKSIILSPQFAVDCNSCVEKDLANCPPNVNYGCEGGFPDYVYQFTHSKGYGYHLDAYPYTGNVSICRSNLKDNLPNNVILPEYSNTEIGKIKLPLKNIIGMYYKGAPTEIEVNPDVCQQNLQQIQAMNQNLKFVKILEKSILRGTNYRSIGLFLPTQNQIEEIMYMLRYYGPMVICVAIEGLEPSYKGGIVGKTYIDKKGKSKMNPLYDPCSLIDHAVVLAGYKKDNGRVIWKIQNSWSPNWGFQGCFFTYADEMYLAGITNVIMDDEYSE